MSLLYRKIFIALGYTFLVIFCTVFLRIIFKASAVAADSLVFYPDFCLGGWEKPQNASKQIDLAQNAGESEFTTENSSFLSSGVASQIFCGYFPIESKEELPKEVSVSFNWMMKNVRYSNLGSPASSVEPSSPVETPESVETINTEENNTIKEDTEEIATPTQEPVSEQVREQEPVKTEAEIPVSEPVIQYFLNLFTKTAYAQSQISLPDFIDISYSVDGIRWISLGKVNAMNYRDYKVTIPVSSWEDLKKIQIMLNIIPTVGEKPDIYLDGMSIEVEYDRPFVEAAQEGLENTASAVVSVIDAVGEKIVSIVQVVEPEKSVQEANNTEPQMIKEKKLVFELSGDVVPVTTFLPWYSDEFRERVGGRGPISSSPNIEVGKEGKSVKISGACNEKYFVVLLWKNKDDYIKKPGSFASNYADTCKDGNFSYDLASISADTPSGDYFLMIAEEDESNPWISASGLVPIKINSIIEEKVISK